MIGSKKPCPSCGEVVDYRRSDEICYECKAARKELQLRREQDAKVEADRESRVAFSMPYAPHAADVPRETGDAFLALLRSVSVPCATPEHGASAHFTRPRDRGSNEGARLMPRPVNDDLVALKEAIKSLAKAEYERGKQDGERFVGRMVRGELSIKDMVSQ